jgi:hypothetical protein
MTKAEEERDGDGGGGAGQHGSWAQRGWPGRQWQRRRPSGGDGVEVDGVAVVAASKKRAREILAA